MKTLKEQIKKSALELKCLKKSTRDTNRKTGYGDYEYLYIQKEIQKMKHLAYCWIKENGIYKGQDFDYYEFKLKHQTHSKSSDYQPFHQYLTKFSDEISERKNSFKNELKSLRNSIKDKKLELKETHRKTGTANYYSIETEKIKFRYKHLAYCLFKKKEIMNLINKDTLILNSLFEELIKKYKLETPNKNGEFKDFSNFELNKELKLLKERS